MPSVLLIEADEDRRDLLVLFIVHVTAAGDSPLVGKRDSSPLLIIVSVTARLGLLILSLFIIIINGRGYEVGALGNRGVVAEVLAETLVVVERPEQSLTRRRGRRRPCEQSEGYVVDRSKRREFERCAMMRDECGNRLLTATFSVSSKLV